MNKIYIDGIETRHRIDKLVGKKNGVKALSDKLGINDATLSKICRRGYGSENLINKYADLGVPFRYSTIPIPCRIKREHTRKPKSNFKPKPISEEHVQISLRDFMEIPFESVTFEKLAVDLIYESAKHFVEEYEKLDSRYRRNYNG